MTASTYISAIETEYAGCRFRSRLEARWAVFFDHLGIPWEYEPQGFETPSGRYLPDFYLPTQSEPFGWKRTGIWVEVKGSDEMLDQRKRQIMLDAVEGLDPAPVLLLGSIPRVDGTVRVTQVAHRGLTWDHEYCFSWLAYFDDRFTDESLVRRSPFEDFDDRNLVPTVEDWRVSFDAVRFTLGVERDVWRVFEMSPRVAAAYKAARSARFEHGEVG